MRIAYVINSMEGGGAQTPLPKIVAALAKAGARVRVLALTRRNGHAIERLQAAGIDPLVREGGESDQIAAYRWICEQAREWGADAIWTSLTQHCGKSLALLFSSPTRRSKLTRTFCVP